MDILKVIAEEFKNHEVSCYYVGGTVRDKILGIPNDDIDICLVGVKDKSLVEHVIRKHGMITQEVGKSFPNWVAILDKRKIDFALARTEKLTGDTRQDFTCSTENVTIIQDLYRRDLTINAIAEDVLTNEIIDPYNGIKDLQNKIARNVSNAFAEDTLRVVRAARFIARFGLTPSKSLIDICKTLNPNDISNERVGMELMKLFTLPEGTQVSKFFYFLKDVNWLRYHFNELANIIGVPQSKSHHPEGCVFTHTMYCIDAAKDWFMRAVMLCHDLGKYTNTTINGIYWKSWEEDRTYFNKDIANLCKVQCIGHEAAGVSLTYNMLKRISFTKHDVISQIGCLVKLHMIRAVINKDNEEKIVRRNLRELMHYNIDYELLVETVRCDLAGRPPLEPILPDIGQQRAKELIENNEMIPVVTGKLLKKSGFNDGQMMGNIIKRALELQDRGILSHENWKQRLKSDGFKLP